VFLGGLAEGVEHDLGGDRGVGAAVQDVAGVVIEPGDDLGVGAVGEPVVGEVGLSALVGHGSLEADVGGFRPLLWLRGDEPLPGQDPGHGGHRHPQR